MVVIFVADFIMKIGVGPDYRSITGAGFLILGIYGLVALKIRNGSIMTLGLYWGTFVIRLVNLIGFCSDQTSGLPSDGRTEFNCTMSISDSPQGGIISYFISWIIFILYILMFFCMIRMNVYWYIYPTGIYGVGHSEVIVTDDDYSITVSRFYPTDKTQYMRDLNDDSKYIKWNIDGDKFNKGLSIAYDVPEFILRDYNTYQLLAVNNAEIDPSFDKEGLKLTPVIFSHGLTSGRTMYSSIVYNLVSYGCIVYTFNHTDTSAAYCCDYSKVPPEDKYYVPYSHVVEQCRIKNEQVNITEQHFVANKLQKRMVDIKRMIDIIGSDAKNKFPAIDMSKLVMMGHSMGGITSIEASNRFEKDIKLCCAIDPYYFPLEDNIGETDDYTIEQPLLIINSELRHQSLKTYDSLNINEVFFNRIKNNNNNSKNVVIKNTDHLNQVDAVLFDSLSLMLMGQVTCCNYKAKYMELIGTILAFLDEHDFLPIKAYMKVDDVVQK